MLQRLYIIGVIFMTLSCVSCISVPKETADLSKNLGHQLQDLHASHNALVHRYFMAKHQKIRNFIRREWIPVFSENFFNQPNVSSAWNKVVNSDNKNDRIEFIKRVYPEIQHQADKRYQNMTAPLNSLENELILAIDQKYSRAQLINQTLTRYLESASKTTEVRTRLLKNAGIQQQEIDQVLSTIDELTDQALNGAQNIEKLEQEFKKYKTKIEDLHSSF